MNASHFFHPKTLELVKTLPLSQIDKEIAAYKKKILDAAVLNQPAPKQEGMLPLYEAAKVLSQAIEKSLGSPVQPTLEKYHPGL